MDSWDAAFALAFQRFNAPPWNQFSDPWMSLFLEVKPIPPTPEFEDKFRTLIGYIYQTPEPTEKDLELAYEGIIDMFKQNTLENKIPAFIQNAKTAFEIYQNSITNPPISKITQTFNTPNNYSLPTEPIQNDPPAEEFQKVSRKNKKKRLNIPSETQSATTSPISIQNPYNPLLTPNDDSTESPSEKINEPENPVKLNSVHPEIPPLSMDTDDQPPSKIPTQTKFKPMLIWHGNNISEITNLISKVINRNPVFLFADKYLKFLPRSELEHISVKNCLDKNNLSFQAHSLNNEKPAKFVIRGIPPTIDPNELKSEIEEKGFSVNHVSPMTSSKTKRPMPMFFCSLNQTPNLPDFLKIKYLNYFAVTIQNYTSNRTPICHNCQLYFHSSVTCKLPPRCMICAESHNTKKLPP